MATNPISTALFLSQFRRAWVLKRTLVPWDRDTSSQLPTRIGLAVSGGADSMAMAFLSREIERTAMAGEISVTALVVDHKAREESSLEARTVAGWLADLGISTKLLELDWSSFMQSADDPVGKEAHQWAPTAFETHARRLRYQAIGSACRDLGISTLLLGHHQDDLVETTLWRMARGARSTGLQGIKEMARIPECQGLFGISESGSSVKAYFKTDDLKNVESARSVLIADGGIFLCRPLLAFPKRHLLDTCHIHNIPYVNDPTNFDPTLTARNAIRHIRASHSLPLALQAPRITALCHTNGDSSKELLRLSNEFLASRCRILETHWDTGTMQIQVLDEKSSEDSLETKLSPAQLSTVQAFSLRRIAELVAPQPANHYTVNSYVPFVHQVFGSMNESGSAKNEKSSSFTCGGVLFSRAKPTREENIWTLGRQPLMKGKNPTSHLKIPIRSSPDLSSSRPIPDDALSWILWDHRFWFRILARTSTQDPSSDRVESHIPIAIRAFQESDYRRLGKSDAPTRGLVPKLKRVFKEQGPTKIRYTIPVLVRDMVPEIDDSEDKAGPLLAMPTTDFIFGGTRLEKSNEMEITHQGRTITLEWEWQYKMIDFEAARLMQGPIE